MLEGLYNLIISDIAWVSGGMTHMLTSMGWYDIQWHDHFQPIVWTIITILFAFVAGVFES